MKAAFDLCFIPTYTYVPSLWRTAIYNTEIYPLKKVYANIYL